jgi:hypothetical protein
LKLSGKHRAAFCFEVATIGAAIVLMATGSWIHAAETLPSPRHSNFRLHSLRFLF